MSWQTCRGCPRKIREGLTRPGKGVDGQELADGRYCWRCRARHARKGPRVRRPAVA